MRPVLFTLFGAPVGGYAFFVGLSFLIAFAIRHVEKRRLGYDDDPRHRFVSLGALLGAVVGAKLGMLLFEPLSAFPEMLRRMASLDFSGKTVVGALAGGYVGVELAKKWVGITRSTGDAFAVALPVAQGIGRLGCLFHGCCYGTPWSGPWAVFIADAQRHPAQLYEALFDFALAAWLWSIRKQGHPEGHLFRRYLVGYAMIRFVVEFVRGDPVNQLGPLSSVQWLCLVVIIGFSVLIWRRERDQPNAAQTSATSQGSERTDEV